MVQFAPSTILKLSRNHMKYLQIQDGPFSAILLRQDTQFLCQSVRVHISASSDHESGVHSCQTGFQTIGEF